MTKLEQKYGTTSTEELRLSFKKLKLQFIKLILSWIKETPQDKEELLEEIKKLETYGNRKV